MTDKGGETTLSKTYNSSTRRRVRVRIWHIGLLLLLSGVVCLLLLRWHWRREFRARVEAARVAGYPVTLEELDAWYRWPSAGENAAIVLLDAASCCSPPRAEDVPAVLWDVIRNRASARWQPFPEDVRDTISQHLGANTEALELLHEVAALRHSRYPIDLTRGYSETMGHLDDVVQQGESPGLP